MQWVRILSGISLTILCWGMYGPMLHKGQHHLGNSRLKPFICVGVAYCILAVILPAVLLASQKKLGGDWSMSGIMLSLLAGTAGACGALGIIIALTAKGGHPIFVMPLVFGCAPVVNVFVAMKFASATKTPSPFFFAGLILVSLGAAMVLVFQPKPVKPAAQPAVEEPAETAAVETPPLVKDEEVDA